MPSLLSFQARPHFAAPLFSSLFFCFFIVRPGLCQVFLIPCGYACSCIGREGAWGHFIERVYLRNFRVVYAFFIPPVLHASNVKPEGTSVHVPSGYPGMSVDSLLVIL